MSSESEDESEEAASRQVPDGSDSGSSTQRADQQTENSPRLLRITNKDVLILPHGYTGGRQLSEVSSIVNIGSFGSHCGPVLHTKITGMIPRPKKERPPSEKNNCAFLISNRLPLFLKHICLLERSSNIVGLISERSFNTLERIYCDLPIGTFPNRQQSIRKISYTADELRNGQIINPTLQCDIYSVGAILYRFYHALDPPNDKRGAVFRTDMSRTVTTLIRNCWGDPQDRPNSDFCVRKLSNEI